MGLWYSPFQLETAGVREPPDAGSIPAPATRLEMAPYGAFSFTCCGGARQLLISRPESNDGACFSQQTETASLCPDLAELVRRESREISVIAVWPPQQVLVV